MTGSIFHDDWFAGTSRMVLAGDPDVAVTTDAAPVLSSCAPAPVTRTSGNLHVELVDLADGHDRFDCLGGFDAWEFDTTRLLTLYRNGKKVGQHPESFGDFTIPAAVGNYRLTYDLDASVVLPVSTRVSTVWTFRSAGPSGTGSGFEQTIIRAYLAR